MQYTQIPEVSMDSLELELLTIVTCHVGALVQTWILLNNKVF